VKRTHTLVAAGAVALAAWIAGAAPVAAADGGAYVLADVQCDAAGQGVLDLTLVNDAQERQAEVTVRDLPSITVAPLSAHALTFTDLADGALTVPILVDGADATVVVSVACDGPTVAVMAATPASTRRTPDAPAQLPSTGGSAGWGLTIGAALVAAGVAASLVARRQHS
jgi:LPXTG-motif cell wall-anchored protein